MAHPDGAAGRRFEKTGVGIDEAGEPVVHPSGDAVQQREKTVKIYFMEKKK
jgi:hypothetical protein